MARSPTVGAMSRTRGPERIHEIARVVLRPLDHPRLALSVARAVEREESRLAFAPIAAELGGLAPLRMAMVRLCISQLDAVMSLRYMRPGTPADHRLLPSSYRIARDGLGAKMLTSGYRFRRASVHGREEDVDPRCPFEAEICAQTSEAPVPHTYFPSLIRSAPEHQRMHVRNAIRSKAARDGDPGVIPTPAGSNVATVEAIPAARRARSGPPPPKVRCLLLLDAARRTCAALLRDGSPCPTAEERVLADRLLNEIRQDFLGA